MSAFEAVVKESEEEASIAEDVARRWVKCTGAISYFFRCVFLLSYGFEFALYGVDFASYGFKFVLGERWMWC